MTQAFAHPLPFGAELQPDGGTLFRIWAPSCDSLQLRLPTQTVPMRKEPAGWFTLQIEAPAGTEYSYVMPDGLAVPDPASRLQQDDVHGPSIVVDPHAYAWQHTEWPGRPWAETVIYELHVGLLGGFNAVTARLPELAELGVTVVELMPLADVPGPRNWGYDGVLPYAPDCAFGTPDELKRLVDTAHGLGLQVMIDCVYNHFGPDGAYIHAFAKSFFRDDIQTPWGAAIDFRRPEVRDYFEQNALYWLQEYRMDGIRFDAVHAISEESFLTEMAAAIRKQTPGRHIHLVLEHEDNAARLLRTKGTEPLFDAQWADDWHHCLHVLLTGEKEGYYEDFQDATALLARCMAEGFAYQGQLAPHLGHPRGEPSGHLPTTAFVICLQNHDQIGNRAMGDRLTATVDPAALRAATAFLLLGPAIPLLFMGEEWASTSPFQFFTSFNEDLAELVRTGRRKEFKSFAAFADPAARERIPDPNAPETFENSRPAHTDPAHPAWIATLLHLRAEHIATGLPARPAGTDILAPGAVRGRWTLRTGQTLTILLNLGKEPISVEPAARTALFATPGAAADHLPPNSTVVLLG